MRLKFYSLAIAFLLAPTISMAGEYDLDSIFSKKKKITPSQEIKSKKIVDDAKETAAKAQSEFYWKHEYVPPQERQHYNFDSQDTVQEDSVQNSHTNSSSSQTKTVKKTRRTVKLIQTNGKILGVPSFLVDCSAASDVVIYYRNGTWHTGGLGHMGHKYDNWSKEEVANYLCR